MKKLFLFLFKSTRVLIFTLLFLLNSIESLNVTALDTNVYISSNISTNSTDGSVITINPNISIDLHDQSTVTGANVAISIGYVSGDILSSSHVDAEWHSDTGILSFSGTYSASDLESIFNSVTFTPVNSKTDISSREITFSIGDGLYFDDEKDGNGHYYQPMSVESNISWLDAKTAAEATENKLFGLQGYLATIITAPENTFIATLTLPKTWFGATDDYTAINTALGLNQYADQSASEGHWYWATGPEAGSLFYEKSTNTAQTYLDSSTTKTFYTGWYSGEPNNFNLGLVDGENFGVLNYYTQGLWNDFAFHPNESSYYVPNYIIEYGGMPGDPDITISQKTNVSIQTYTLTYDGNTSTSGITPNSITQRVGTSTTVSTKNTLAKTNYSFVNWNTQADGSGTSYAANSTITLDSDITLYAQWKSDYEAVLNGVYSSLDSAINNAVDGDTIYLLKDFTKNTFIRIKNKSITITSEIGHTYTITKNGLNAWFGIEEGSTLNLSNVILDGNNTDSWYSIIFVGQYDSVTSATPTAGNLVINDGVVIKNFYYQYTDANKYASVINVFNGTVTINGGDIFNNRDKYYPSVIYVSSLGTLNINGGSIHDNSSIDSVTATNTYGTIYIETGGMINVSANASVVNNKNTNNAYTGDFDIQYVNNSQLNISDNFTGKIGIYSNSFYQTNDVFGTITSGKSIANGTIINNKDSSLYGVVNGTNLVWQTWQINITSYSTDLTNGNIDVTASTNVGTFDGTINTSQSETYTFTQNGTYTFSARNSLDTTKTETITISNIDKTAPVINLSASTTVLTNQDITINASISDDHTYISKYALGTQDTSYFQTAGTSFTSSFIVSENGTYTIYALDAAGNASVNTISISNIDKTAPEITGISEGGYYTSDQSISFSDGTAVLSGTLTINPFVSGSSINQDGTYTLTVTDSISNQTVIHFTIDNTSPVISLSAPSTLTNSNVTISAEINEVNLDTVKWASGSQTIDYFSSLGTVFDTSFTVSDNGTYSVYAVDKVGHQSLQTITIDTIDTTSPIVSLSPSITSLTNNNVIITASIIEDHLSQSKWASGEQLASYFINSGTVFNSSFSVSENGVYSVYVKDALGYETVETISISNIDKIAPVVTGVIEGQSYNSDLIVQYNEGTATLNGSNYNSGVSISGAGDYVLVVTDSASNQTIVNFTIDTTAPSFTGINNGEISTTDIAISFTSGSATLNGIAYTSATNISADGNYEFVISDSVGNSTTVNFKIDKTAPAISLSAPSTITNQNLNITANITEANLSISKWASGVQTASYFLGAGTVFTSNFSVSENGTYTVYAKDDAGYETVETITISNIDKIVPTIQLSADTSLTNQNVSVLSVISETNTYISKYASGNQTIEFFSSEGIDFTSSFNVSENGVYTVYARDLAGNESVNTITINSIYRVLPLINLSVNGSSTASQSISTVLSVSVDSSVSLSSIAYQWTNSSSFPSTGFFTSTTNNNSITLDSVSGTYYLHVQAIDNLGNIKEYSSLSFNLDNSAPELDGIINGESYNTDIKILFTEGQANLTGTLSSGSEVLMTNLSSGEIISEEGDYNLVISDELGNENSIDFTIDKTAPIISVPIIPTTTTNQDVTITVSSNEGTLNTTSHTFTENGSFTFIATDNAGNITETIVTVSNINKTSTSTTDVSTALSNANNQLDAYLTSIIDPSPAILALIADAKTHISTLTSSSAIDAYIADLIKKADLQILLDSKNLAENLLDNYFNNIEDASSQLIKLIDAFKVEILLIEDPILLNEKMQKLMLELDAQVLSDEKKSAIEDVNTLISTELENMNTTPEMLALKEELIALIEDLETIDDIEEIIKEYEQKIVVQASYDTALQELADIFNLYANDQSADYTMSGLDTLNAIFNRINNQISNSNISLEEKIILINQAIYDFNQVKVARSGLINPSSPSFDATDLNPKSIYLSVTSENGLAKGISASVQLSKTLGNSSLVYDLINSGKILNTSTSIDIDKLQSIISNQYIFAEADVQLLDANMQIVELEDKSGAFQISLILPEEYRDREDIKILMVNDGVVEVYDTVVVENVVTYTTNAFGKIYLMANPMEGDPGVKTSNLSAFISTGIVFILLQIIYIFLLKMKLHHQKVLSSLIILVYPLNAYLYLFVELIIMLYLGLYILKLRNDLKMEEMREDNDRI